jgi:hypothetical protein
MNKVFAPALAIGGLGMLGVFVLEDPEPKSTLMQKGRLARLLREWKRKGELAKTASRRCGVI